MFNRIKNAGLALAGKLPEYHTVTKYVDREVVGDIHATTLYQWRDPDAPIVIRLMTDLMANDDAKNMRYAHTCEQAHEECKGAPVTKVKALLVGQTYFLLDSTRAIKVLPKPKRAKGRG